LATCTARRRGFGLTASGASTTRRWRAPSPSSAGAVTCRATYCGSAPAAPLADTRERPCSVPAGAVPMSASYRFRLSAPRNSPGSLAMLAAIRRQRGLAGVYFCGGERAVRDFSDTMSSRRAGSSMGGRSRPFYLVQSMQFLFLPGSAASVRSAAYCGKVHARLSISDGRSLARSRLSNGLKLWPNQSVLFRHPTNANSIAWQHLPKVLIQPADIKSAGVLHFVSELRASRTRSV
jgi:hypothetical protein